MICLVVLDYVVLLFWIYYFIVVYSIEKEEKVFCYNFLKFVILVYISYFIFLNILNCLYYINMKVIIVIMIMLMIVNDKLLIEYVKK